MATIRDVARLAGVGIGTVSRVLSENGSVSQKTLTKVNDAMAALNFTPNSSARALSSKKYNKIGIWGTETSGELDRKTLIKIEHELEPFNIKIIVTDGDKKSTKNNTHNSPQTTHRKSIENIFKSGCDGLIIWGSDISALEIIQIENEYPNIVLLNNKVDLLPDKSFTFDHYQAGYFAAKNLIDNGHTKIACITGWLDTDDGNLRQQGFLDALNDNNIDIPNTLIFEGNYTFRKGYEGALHLLNQKTPFTAIFCGNDQSAMAAISALTKKGFNVPNDISIMGYDDMNIASYTLPPLSTIQMPFQKMAISATRRLLNLCYNLDLEVNYDFPIKLINRESVRNLKD